MQNDNNPFLATEGNINTTIGNESLSSVAYFRLLTEGSGNRLQTSFYPGKGWKFLPVFNNLRIAENWQSHEFQINQEKVQKLIAGQSSTFALLCKEFLQIDTAGKYTFYTHSDDGSKLYVNNELWSITMVTTVCANGLVKSRWRRGTTLFGLSFSTGAEAIGSTYFIMGRVYLSKLYLQTNCF